ncbi:uncharacterized protein RCC_04694 [Ramularia collo-cygni]|uniref:Uncharacterized protein n=1 Tax=Ramularia collo-cygni TaxID=112498 RepID=A0A2D3VB93_9PEZI|nr:uncharacterized protein RCC_04694 [Ramularia collo-cygni]CZT18849.1 uncharacterized protein RCC_04694 [Ramularia collo-cygni]
MAFSETFKAVFIPAMIAVILYALLAFVIMPMHKRHRERYAQYMPLDSISRGTNSLRDRISSTITAWVVPRRHLVFDAADSRRGSASGDDFVYDGDELAGFDVDRTDRRVRGGDVEA